MAFIRNSSAIASAMVQPAGKQHTPAEAEGVAVSDQTTQPEKIAPDASNPDTEAKELQLCTLAQAELLELASSLAVLCQSAVDGPACDEARLETLQYLMQRLETASELLGALDNRDIAGSSSAEGRLHDLVQQIVSAQWFRAARKHLTLDVDSTGAVHTVVPGSLAVLIELMLSSAIRAAPEAGTIAIVSRREGQAVTIAMLLPSLGQSDPGYGIGAFDLAILRNLAIRRGGRFSISQRNPAEQQWVLRLPLAVNEKETAGESAVTHGWQKASPGHADTAVICKTG